MAKRMDSFEERLLLDEFRGMLEEMDRIGVEAPDGAVLDQLEGVVLGRGSKLLRQAQAAKVQATVEVVEKKWVSTCSHCQAPWRNKGTRQRRVVTAAGPIEVGRRYHSCPKCRLAGFTADDRLALERGQTTRARQRLCLFGSLTGFARAAAHVKEVRGWTVSPNTLGRICKAEGVALELWRAAAEAKDFQAAAGGIVMLVDGTMVNTVEDGWQETKLAAVDKRPSGAPAVYSLGATLYTLLPPRRRRPGTRPTSSKRYVAARFDRRDRSAPMCRIPWTRLL